MKRLGWVLLCAWAGMAVAQPPRSASDPGTVSSMAATTTMDPALRAALEATLVRQDTVNDPQRPLQYSEQRVMANNTLPSERFAYSVAISGRTALIGVIDGRGSTSNRTGTAFIFTEQDGVWTEQQQLIGRDGPAGSSFGASVAIHGSRAIVGAYVAISGDIPLQNAAYVFTESNGVWSQAAVLVSQPTASIERFAQSVAISDTTALVGAYAGDTDPYTPKQGVAYVFTETNGTWPLTQRLTADDAKAGDGFGISVALDGDTALIGAKYATIRRDVQSQGAAYVFSKADGQWTQTQKLIAPDGAAGDYFGTAVALSADSALIGAPNVHGNGQFQGAAYVFKSAFGGWGYQQKLVARNGGGSTQFGRSVALSQSGTMAVIGAPTGGAGVPMGESAHVFTESAGRWTERRKLLPSVGMPEGSWEQYASAVAVDAGVGLVSANFEGLVFGDSSMRGAAYFYAFHASAMASLTPAAWNLTLNAGGNASVTLNIANHGGEALDYVIGESAGSAPRIALNPHTAAMTTTSSVPRTMSAAIGRNALRGPRSLAPWQDWLAGSALTFGHDDGSYEDAVTLNHGYDEGAALWLNRFSPLDGTGAFTLDSISIQWPQNAFGTLVGREVNLVAYHDADADGDPSNAVRLGSEHRVTIAALDQFVDYPVNFAVPGDGDIYVGFETAYARGDNPQPIYPAALDRDSQDHGRSWLIGKSVGDPDLAELGNNGYLGTIEAFGLNGNWLIRATGSNPSNDCLAASDVPWLNVASPSGTVAPNATQPVTISISSGDLEDGQHTALLCVATNDPLNRVVRVPVSVTVRSRETLFHGGFEAP